MSRKRRREPAERRVFSPTFVKKVKIFSTRLPYWHKGWTIFCKPFANYFAISLYNLSVWFIMFHHDNNHYQRSNDHDNHQTRLQAQFTRLRS